MIYSGPAMTLCFSLTAFAYTLLFGGNYKDGLCAMFVGALLYMVNSVFSKDVSFPFITYFAGGFAAAVMSSAAAGVFPGTNAYVVTVGAVTNMLPGVALINGIRDLLYGDSVSGLTKFGEAIMIVAVIAAGSGIGLALWIYGGSL